MCHSHGKKRVICDNAYVCERAARSSRVCHPSAEIVWGILWPIGYQSLTVWAHRTLSLLLHQQAIFGGVKSQTWIKPIQACSSSFRVVQTAILYERIVYISNDTIAMVSEPSPIKEPSHGWQTLGCIEVFLVLGSRLAGLRENAGSLLGSSLTLVSSFASVDVLAREECFVSSISKQCIGRPDPSAWLRQAWQSNG